LPDVTLLLGDCLDRLKDLPDGSIDACVTDPPYGLSFMGKAWDRAVPSVEVWQEVYRVLKPGAHLLAFFGTRTYHRGAVAIEDAGFEIRDQIGWAFGSGFPKSHDVSKAIDREAGAQRATVEVEAFNPKAVGRGKDGAEGATRPYIERAKANGGMHAIAGDEPATDAAAQWQGWGSALKPAWEPIVVARKPLEGTIAANVQAHGTGALNIDGCRVGTDGGCSLIDVSQADKDKAKTVNAYGRLLNAKDRSDPAPGKGRWPANLIHDGSPEVVALFPQTGASRIQPRNQAARVGQLSKGDEAARTGTMGVDDLGGSAARFFYSAKADKPDREAGLAHMARATLNRVNAGGLENDPRWAPIERANAHPTVKPTDLMRYLCRLITPPGGVVLDPFMGSGSTGRGAMLEGFGFVGIEIDPAYLEIARARIAEANPIDDPPPLDRPGQLSLFTLAKIQQA
jgi:DNA modification methylase